MIVINPTNAKQYDKGRIHAEDVNDLNPYDAKENHCAQ